MKRILYNKTNIIFIILLLVAAILRFLCLDKIDGLWYDEIISYKQASQPNIFSVILYTLTTDLHFPLYQIMLHYWIKIFSFSDYSLRVFSAICGILTVLVSYFVGKELKDKQTGLICASIFAVNSFLIYYSQEVRMYSLLTLFLTLYLLFLVRIKNDYKNKWNYFWLTLCSFAVIASYTIAVVFILVQILGLIIYLINQNKQDKEFIFKRVLICCLSLGILCLPLFGFLYLFRFKYSEYFGGLSCDWSSAIVFLQDWFSPVIQIVSPLKYEKILFSNLDIFTFVFIFTPVLLAIASIIYSVKKDKFSWVILSGALIFLLSEIFMVKVTYFQIAPRHTMVILPNLLILVGYGFSLINGRKNLKKVIISIFLILNLFYLSFMPNSAFRLPRSGYRPLSQMINSSGIKEDDFVVVWNRKEVLDKYVKVRLNIVSILKNFAYTSEVILNNEKTLNGLSLKDRKKVLREYFSDENTPVNTSYIMNAISNHMKPGQKFIITTTANLASYDKKSFAGIVKNDKQYNETSFNDLMTIKSLLDIKDFCYKKFRFIEKKHDNQFIVWIFEKK